MVDGEYQQGVIKSSLGNFGHFDYGTTIKGRVHYPITNSDACEPLTNDDFDGEHLQQGIDQGHQQIILVDRGNCHFVVKAQNVQRFGAVMVIVVDNKIMEDPTLLVMADDGSGNSVIIPSMLIGWNDGEELKAAIHEQEDKAKKHGNQDDESADEGHDEEENKDGYRDYNGAKHKGGKGKGKQVIVQAEITLATKTKGKIDVDLWYTGTYEFLQSGWEMSTLAKMQDIFVSNINF